MLTEAAPSSTTRTLLPPLGRPRYTGYLGGLDGLRAISVIAVLLYHAALPRFRGGFLGVDVFFVISGFLITHLMVAEREGSGTISLRGFWMRRARRLLPALYVLLVTVAVMAVAFYREEMANLRGQILSALFYVTNWYLIASGQSYFDTVTRPLALQHLWSLAVEEQFYLVWPLVMTALFWLLRGRLRAIAVVVTLGAVASAWWMAHLFDPVGDPSRVYYSTLTRASALLLGSALALVWNPGPARTRSYATATTAVGTVGLVAVVAMLLTVDDMDPFLYRGGFVLVALFSLLAIVGAATPGTFLADVVLANPVMRYVGTRSYGLYLWHWPIYVVTRPGIDVHWGVYPTLAFRLALTFACTELTFRLVEQPVRRGALSRFVAGLRRTDSRMAVRRQRFVVVTGLVLALLGVSLWTQFASADRSVGMIEAAIVGSADPAAATGSAVDLFAAPTTAANAPPTPPTTANPYSMTVISDSVLLSGRSAIEKAFTAEGWTVDYRAKPALMIHEANTQLRDARRSVGKTVVVGLGYNSLWERDRANYDAWAKQFDKEFEDLMLTLKLLGAERVVWVTVREPSPGVVPAEGADQMRRYSWFFPYVNEQLRKLAPSHPELVLADWAAVSDVPGITYDAIHLNDKGAQLMVQTIRQALDG